MANTRRIGIIIQARMGSTRLPSKVLRELEGRPMLAVLLERVKRSRHASVIIVATTENKQDDAIAACARECGVEVYRGDTHDVLKRYFDAATAFGLDLVVRVTADCPFTDPELIDAMVEQFGACDYLSNTRNRTFPRGFDIEIFTYEALRRATAETREPYQREHVTPYIFEHFVTDDYRSGEDASRYRVTVDTKPDFLVIEKLLSLLREKPNFGYRDVIDMLKKHPEIANINSAVCQKEFRE